VNLNLLRKPVNIYNAGNSRFPLNNVSTKNDFSEKEAKKLLEERGLAVCFLKVFITEHRLLWLNLGR
jgi:hypothetical protein